MTDLGVDEAVEYVARAAYGMWQRVHALDDPAPPPYDEMMQRSPGLTGTEWFLIARAALAALTESRPCPTCGGTGRRVYLSDDRVRADVGPIRPVAAKCEPRHGTGVLDSLAVLRTDLEQVAIEDDDAEPTSTLMFAVIVPGLEKLERNDELAEDLASEFVNMLNEERGRNGGWTGPIAVSATPGAQFLTRRTISRYRRADDFFDGQPVFILRTSREVPGDEK